MILERAMLQIVPGREQEFERAFPSARGVISQAAGFRSLSVQRCIEDPSAYLLLIEWENLEDHTVGFRESDLFTQWRALLGEFFAEQPAVLHFERLQI